MSRPAIVLSRLDVERIENLLDRLPAAEARQHESLRSELERAEVREPNDMPADVVTMNSTVTFSEEGGRTTMAMLTEMESKEARDGLLETGMESGLQEGLDLIERIAIELAEAEG